MLNYTAIWPNVWKMCNKKTTFYDLATGKPNRLGIVLQIPFAIMLLNSIMGVSAVCKLSSRYQAG
ncbi:hypothetical protein GCM10008111_21490 [Alishewanella tabrizica]|uniref:Uncharacterized protein n=1 Tax=Alishewanella tabrizica TaxID=671278 RepID=A0ABQ2WQ89_9ALTE|nr:hypothetical protein GCM10008111_21490 [Alishewanella tabrizica]